MKKIRLIAAILAVAVILTLVGCDEVTTPPTLSDTLQNSAQQAAANQQNLEQAIPAPKLSYSNERANLSKRAETFGSDQNKVSWIYLFADNGVIITFSSVKGKVSNLSSYLVPDETIVKDPFSYGSSYQGQVVQAPDIDGSYGTNGSGVFWYDTQGIYHEWNGLYYLSDQPVQLRQQPVVVTNGDK